MADDQNAKRSKNMGGLIEQWLSQNLPGIDVAPVKDAIERRLAGGFDAQVSLERKTVTAKKQGTKTPGTGGVKPTDKTSPSPMKYPGMSAMSKALLKDNKGK